MKMSVYVSCAKIQKAKQKKRYQPFKKKKKKEEKPEAKGSLALPDRPLTGSFQRFKVRETVQIAELLTFSRKSSQF